MKSKFVAFSLTVFTAGAILVACNSSGKKTNESSTVNSDSIAQVNAKMADTVNTAKNDWEKFKADAGDKIRQDEDSISVFKLRIEKKDAKMKAKYERQISKLEVRKNELKARLTDYKDEGQDKWGKFETDFTGSIDSLDTDIKDFFKGHKK